MHDPAGYDDAKSILVGKLESQVACVGAYNEQRIGGENPNRGHLRDCKCLGRPPEIVRKPVEKWGRENRAASLKTKDGRTWHLHDKINSTAECNCQSTIKPIQYPHPMLEPQPGLRDTVLTYVDQDRAKTNDSSRNEQTLSRMLKACFEGFWVQIKPPTDHAYVEKEEDDIQKEKHAANFVEAVEAERD